MVVARSVNCASENVFATPFDVITVVGSVYRIVDVVVLPDGKYGLDVGRKVIRVVIPPLLMVMGSGCKLVVKAKVKEFWPGEIGMFQKLMTAVVTSLMFQ